MQWETDDNAEHGEYTIEVIGTDSEGITYSVAYKLTILRDCSS